MSDAHSVRPQHLHASQAAGTQTCNLEAPPSHHKVRGWVASVDANGLLGVLPKLVCVGDLHARVHEVRDPVERNSIPAQRAATETCAHAANSTEHGHGHTNHLCEPAHMGSSRSAASASRKASRANASRAALSRGGCAAAHTLPTLNRRRDRRQYNCARKATTHKARACT
jgi:hypothetical protein